MSLFQEELDIFPVKKVQQGHTTKEEEEEEEEEEENRLIPSLVCDTKHWQHVLVSVVYTGGGRYIPGDRKTDTGASHGGTDTPLTGLYTPDNMM